MLYLLFSIACQVVTCQPLLSPTAFCARGSRPAQPGTQPRSCKRPGATRRQSSCGWTGCALTANAQTSLPLFAGSPAKNLTLVATCRRILGGGKTSWRSAGRAVLAEPGRARLGANGAISKSKRCAKLPGQSARSLPVPPKILLSFHDFERTPPLPPRLVHASRGEADAIKNCHAEREQFQIACGSFILRETRRTLFQYPWEKSHCPHDYWRCGKARRARLRSGRSSDSARPGLFARIQTALSSRLHHANDRDLWSDRKSHRPFAFRRLLHNTGFIAAKRNAVYLPFLVENLREFLKAIPEFALRGFSVTLPHKQTILKYLADCDPMAEKNRGGEFDHHRQRKRQSSAGRTRITWPCCVPWKKKLRLRDSRILILGAGGSARAAAFALGECRSGKY